MVHIGTENDEIKLESIAMNPYPLQIGQNFDVYINGSISKMPTHNMQTIKHCQLLLIVNVQTVVHIYFREGHYWRQSECNNEMADCI